MVVEEAPATNRRVLERNVVIPSSSVGGRWNAHLRLRACERRNIQVRMVVVVGCPGGNRSTENVERLLNDIFKRGGLVYAHPALGDAL